MRWHATRRGAAAVLAAGVFVGVLAGPAVAWHWRKWGWRDHHWNYPHKPHGYHEIVDVFGQPCNDRADKNLLWWRAADNGEWYPVYFHKRLGGDWSTNLDNDVRGHIGNAHLDWAVLSGIWGYHCRFKTSGDGWSTHAWGIAVDVSASYEHYGQCGSSVNYHHAYIWRDHRWKWFECGDPMHFQYAADY